MHRLVRKYIQLMMASMLLFLLFAEQAKAQKASLNLDTTSIRIGEQVKIKLTATLPKNARIYWPAVPDTFTSHVEIVNRSKVDTNVTTRKDFLNYCQAFTITSFDTGFHYIPPLNIDYSYKGDTAKHNLLTEGVYLSVRTVEVDTTKAIRDIKANMQAPITFGEIAPLLGILLALAALASLIWYYIWRKRANKPLIPLLVKPQGPPWEKALQMLASLKERRLWQHGRIKEYYTDLTDILRVYLKEQHHIDAPDMVSSEIIESCTASNLDINSIKQLEVILESADFVKFAKAQPQASENERCLDYAVQFVENTKPLPELVSKAAEPASNEVHINEELKA